MELICPALAASYQCVQGRGQDLTPGGALEQQIRFVPLLHLSALHLSDGQARKTNRQVDWNAAYSRRAEDDVRLSFCAACEEEPEGRDRTWRKVATSGRAGRLLERKQVGKRKGGRQAEKQRAGAGFRNPPLHLLVVYSFMFSHRLTS